MKTSVASGLIVARGSIVMLAQTRFPSAPVELAAREKSRLDLLMGQPNMSGRGVVETKDKTPPPRVLRFSTSGLLAGGFPP